MSQRDAKTALVLFLPLSVTLLAASILVSSGGGMTPSDSAYDQINVFSQVVALIEEDYVEDVDGWSLLYASLRGMTRELDRYSSFYPPAEGQRFSEDTHREYFGVGFAVRPETPPVTIDYLFKNSPAEREGLKPGDRIIAVDGVPIDEEDVGKATAAIKGPLGTRVNLTVVTAASGTEREFTVTRAKIQQPTVFMDHFHDPNRSIAYVRINAFGENTADEFDAVLKQCLERGESLQGLVLDLRFNQGGLVPSCVQIANRFLSSGVIVAIRHRDEEKSKVEMANRSDCWAPELPVVVLVNRFTASAAEILAGALQDHKRALLVGDRTFGKGVVQSVYQIPIGEDDERSAVLKFTTSVYLTPSGRVIEKSLQSQKGSGGLEPDVSVRLGEDDQALIDLQRRFEILEVPGEYRDAYLAARDRSMRERNDPQLDAALKALQGETLAQDF